MINLSLGLLRMEQGIYTLVPKVVDLLAILQEIRATLSFMISSKKVALEVRIGGRSPVVGERFSVWGEELLCYSLLANMVKNGLEASPPRGKVVVSLQTDGEMRLVEIRNSGAIPKSVRVRLFEKYVTSGKKGGSGLGLYSARLMTEIQKGSLHLEVDTANETRFCVRLPPVPVA